MNKISLAENEIKIAENFLENVLHQRNDDLAIMIAKFIFHPKDFTKELGEILLSVTREDYEANRKDFISQLPDNIKDNANETILCSLYIDSKVDAYKNAISTIEVFSKYEENIEKLKNELEIDIGLYFKYISTFALHKALEWYPMEKEESHPEIRIGGKKPNSILFPTDKVSSVLYSSGLGIGTHEIGVEKSGSQEKITTYLTIDFDALENSTGITFKKLTPFDKRVYIAAGALLQAGNRYFSATQLYRAMGGIGSPSTNQIKNIVDSCKKMMGYRILIDNHQEAADYNYSEFQRELLFMFPVEIHENISINGRTVKVCFEFLKDELPLLKFARERNHTETYTLEQWSLPFSMTDDNILLDDYFRRNIHRLNGKKGKKETYTGNLTYTTIYEKYGIDIKKRLDAKARQKISRLSKKGGDIETLLNHYQKTGMIQGYKTHKDEIAITV